MSPTLRWLLGLHSADRASWSDGRLMMTGLPAGIAASLLVVIIVWSAINYWRDGNTPSWWVKAPLLTLRALASACLLLILMEPVLTSTRTSEQRPTVVILADRSQSMSFRDPRMPEALAKPFASATGADPRSLSRTDQAAALLGDARLGAIHRLGARHEVRLYGFAEAAELTDAQKARADAAASIASLERGGDTTQIGTAIRAALDDNSGRPVAGILLVTDGGSNEGDEPLGWARRARAMGIPIFTVGIGDPTPTRDIEVTETLADRVVRKGNETHVYVGVSHRGYASSMITVTLSRNGSTIATKAVRLTGNAAKQTVSFAYTPRQTGDYRYTATVGRLAGETTGDNNSRTFLQQVVDKKLKVLYVEGLPRWEYRYLRNAILRDEQIGFACFRTEVGDAPEAEGNLPVAAFPTDERQLFAYDIVILGDVPRSRLKTTQLRALRRFVEDRGGSLVIIAGERHMPHEYAETHIEPVFPLIVRSSPDQVVMDEPFRWSRTPQGAQDALLRMAPDPREDERIWREMPGMLWMAGSDGPKPGATVLAVNPDRATASGPRPVVALQPFGAGRCLMVMTDSTWRWRWRVGDRHFYRFWGQVLRTMTPNDNPGGNRLAQITVDRIEYRPGDRITITARLLDEFYRPSRAPQLAGSLIGPAARGAAPASRGLAFRPVPGSPGLYTAEAVAGAAGEYRANLTHGGGTAASARFIVRQVSLEAQQPEMDEATLRRLAALSGGRFLRAEELAGWISSLKPKPLTVRTTIETPLWNAPIGLMFALGLLSAEWVLRRRVGLS